MAESDGTLDSLILVRKSILTELDYSFNVSLRSGDVPAATEGMQCLHTILSTITTPLSHTHSGADFVFPEDLPLFFPSENDT